MTWWRCFVQWLAEREIAAEIQWERAQCACAVKLYQEVAYAKGKLEGTQEAFNAIDAAMRERMGGGQDAWNAEDLARAKKGLLH